MRLFLCRKVEYPAFPGARAAQVMHLLPSIQYGSIARLSSHRAGISRIFGLLSFSIGTLGKGGGLIATLLLLQVQFSKVPDLDEKDGYKRSINLGNTCTKEQFDIICAQLYKLLVVYLDVIKNSLRSQRLSYLMPTAARSKTLARLPYLYYLRVGQEQV